MNKSKLKSFAVDARNELLEKVELQARHVGVTEDSIKEATFESSDALFIEGRQLFYDEKNQRNKLIQRIKEIGFNQVMEEAAYTWFNRLIALRFMEVNDYLPTRVRVLSSTVGSREPDMIKEALSLDLDLDKQKIYEWKLNNQTEELFKYLIIAHCNDLNEYLPFMFGTIEDYTELLFPEGLLNTDSFVQKMIDTEVFPEEDWKDVEIIGWLYQFYISEEKDRVFKAKGKYTAKEIPAATQLFTPDWIVRYLVQNSVGRLWVESHPEQRHLTKNWELYINNEQPEYADYIKSKTNSSLRLEDIKILDPAMGSGHILVYAFDILIELYVENGYLRSEIPKLIIENNLYGLEIDDRAYQLACYSIVMKAMQYDSRFLDKFKRSKIEINFASINETNSFTEKTVQILAGEESGYQYENTKAFINQYRDAKIYGSLIKTTVTDSTFLEKRLLEIVDQSKSNFLEHDEVETIKSILPLLIKQDKLLSEKYDVLVMNPPYMGSRNMNNKLKDFLNINYPNGRRDLWAAFMELDHLLEVNGFYAAITMHSWMFLSSYSELRLNIILKKHIDSMLHLGPRAFDEIGGEVVQTTAFILRNSHIDNIHGTYLRLVDLNNSSLKKEHAKSAIENTDVSFRYTFDQSEFPKIPDSPIAYWVSTELIEAFQEGTPLNDLITPKQGLATTDNNQFLRLWWETRFKDINFESISTEDALLKHVKWVPYNKGGKRRQWYGNYDYLVNWENDGKEIKRNVMDKYTYLETPGFVVKNTDYYFKEAITWPLITSSGFSIRYRSPGSIHDVSGMSAFSQRKEKLLYIMGVLSTNIADYIFKILNPTINLQAGDFNNFPVIVDENNIENVVHLVETAIDISKLDWDTFETSWDFKANPLVKDNVDGIYESIEISASIEDKFSEYKAQTNNIFSELKNIEEKLNKEFIKIYNLQDDVNSEVLDKDITIAKIFDESTDIDEEIKGNQYVLIKKDVIKQFISYAVGVMFGRYSLDEEGLVYAGGDFDLSKYKSYPVVTDNIIPVNSSVYLEDDIVNRFVKFVEIVYGKETLEDNLRFIADALGQRKNETTRETLYRYFFNDFSRDHAKMYSVPGSGKRPIYWEFTSGKEKAFNCFIYMHRYDETTFSRIRTEYVHEVQQRLDMRKSDLDNVINSNACANDISKARKELIKIEKQIDELIKYDEKLGHMADQQIEIDLDDGFKVNYPKFEGLVSKV